VSTAATGTDFINGVPNIVVVGIAAYLVFSLIGDTKRGANRVRSVAGAVPRAVGRQRAALTRAKSAYQAALTGNA